MNTTFPLLGDLTAQEQQGFLRTLVQTRHEPEEILFREGDPGDYMLLILEGNLRLSRLAPSAEEVRLADLGPGDVVGEMAVLSPAPRSATATCLSETTVAWLSRDNLLERLVLEDRAAGILLRLSTEQVSNRLAAVRTRIELLRKALSGESSTESDAELEELIRAEAGPIAENLRKWLESR
ncbi:MAG: cyclic nucleotide-binding domain-containing protein [Myxococcota bacterium]|nr:cyclic nucleotide-binding domain-containing protein [Myxococcota bacterium]